MTKIYGGADGLNGQAILLQSKEKAHLFILIKAAFST